MIPERERGGLFFCFGWEAGREGGWIHFFLPPPKKQRRDVLISLAKTNTISLRLGSYLHVSSSHTRIFFSFSCLQVFSPSFIIKKTNFFLRGDDGSLGKLRRGHTTHPANGGI